MNYTLMIAGMAVVTVFVKAIFFILGDRVVFPEWLKLALNFVPVTVLTAIITPMILSPHGKELELNMQNPQLIAAVIAVAISWYSGRQMLTITVGLVSFFGLQYFLFYP